MSTATGTSCWQDLVRQVEMDVKAKVEKETPQLLTDFQQGAIRFLSPTPLTRVLVESWLKVCF